MSPFSEINWQPGLEERRRFALSLAVGLPCLVVGMFAVGRWRGVEWPPGFLLAVGGGGAALGLVLWLVPQMARPFYVAWYAVACGIGLVAGNLLFAAVYLLMFAPVGLALRALGRKALSKGFDRDSPSYWRNAPAMDQPERYYRQF